MCASAWLCPDVLFSFHFLFDFCNFNIAIAIHICWQRFWRVKGILWFSLDIRNAIFHLRNAQEEKEATSACTTFRERFFFFFLVPSTLWTSPNPQNLFCFLSIGIFKREVPGRHYWLLTRYLVNLSGKGVLKTWKNTRFMVLTSEFITFKFCVYLFLSFILCNFTWKESTFHHIYFGESPW